MAGSGLTLRFCVLALTCLALIRAEQLSNKVGRYVDYLKDITSFLLSLPSDRQDSKNSENIENYSTDKGGGGVSESDGIGEGFDRGKDKFGEVVESTYGDGAITANNDKNNLVTNKGDNTHNAINPYNAPGSDEYVTPRCTHSLEKPLITKFNIVYRDNETTPGYECTHISWRIYSHLGTMKITPVYFSIHPSMRSYRYLNINNDAGGDDEDTTTLTVYDGFDESSPVLMKTSKMKNGQPKLLGSYSSSTKRIFVKVTSSCFPTGWDFILKVETVAKNNNYMPHESYKRKEGEDDGENGDKPYNVATVGKSFSSYGKNYSGNKKNGENGLEKDSSKDSIDEDLTDSQHQPPLYSQNKHHGQLEQNSLPESFRNNRKDSFKQHQQQQQQQQQQHSLQPKHSPQHQQDQASDDESEGNKNEDKRISGFGVIPGLRLEGDRRLVEGCDGVPMILTTNYGAFYSPNFQLATGYPSNSNCSWLITVDPGNVITLLFVSFSIEPPFPLTSLCFDALRIYDGPTIDSTTLKATYCGNRIIEDFVSSTNQLFINFKADSGMNNWPGFAIKYFSKPNLTQKKLIPQCGVPKTQPNIYSRIVGGIQAKPHSWPWQISLQYEGDHICGACLLTSRWAITAAHCIVDLEDLSHLYLRLGEHNLTRVDGSEETRQIDGWHIHPNYNTNTNDYDLALIHLSQEVSFNDFVTPACLPSRTDNYNNLICIVAGWGTTKEKESNVVLNQLTVLFIDSSICNGRSWYDGRVTKNMFCAGYKEGRRDSCQGDSGGPLVCSDGKSWSIYGVISWGFDCAQPHRPGVYTNVTMMQEWIVDRIKESPHHL